MTITLDDRGDDITGDGEPESCTESSGCSDWQLASGEAQSIEEVAYGKLSGAILSAKGAGLVTGLFFYQDTGLSERDEVDIEILGSDTESVVLTYFAYSASATMQVTLPLGFDSSVTSADYSILWEEAQITFEVDGPSTDIVYPMPIVPPGGHPCGKSKVIANLWAVNEADAGAVAWAGGDFIFTEPVTATFTDIRYESLDGDCPTATAASTATPSDKLLTIEALSGSDFMCQSGQGVFSLLPVQSASGTMTVSRPIQIGGVGSLTDNAWIRRGRVVSSNTEQVTALNDNRQRSSGTTGGFGNVGRQSFELDPSWQEFPEGAVSGGTHFLTSVTDNLWGAPAVELGWTCPTEFPTAAASTPHPEQAYSFTLGDIGCPVDWPQRFTIIPQTQDPRPTVSLGLYGQPNDRRKVRLEPDGIGVGHSFEYTQKGLKVQGTILGVGPQAGSIFVDLKAVTYLGSAICTPGIYQLGF